MALSPSLIALAALCAALLEAPREPRAPEPPPPRVEYFMTFGSDGEPTAVIAWRRVESERGVLLERDVVFRDGALRVLHNERLDVEAPRLVWRELRGGAGKGRTWLAEAGRPGELRTLSWGTHAPVHGQLAPGPSARMPLALVEELRAGTAPRLCSWLDPLAAGAEVITIEHAWAPLEGGSILAGCAGNPAPPRCATLRRSDGSVARRFVLRGAELTAYQWSEGAPWALRVDVGRGRELEARWRAGGGPVEAASAPAR